MSYEDFLPIYYTKVGVPFCIPLKSNPSTGFEWNISYSPPFLRLVNEKYVSDPIAPGMVGVGGTQVFTFVADYASDGVVSFEYARPWGESGNHYAARVVAYFWRL